MPDAPDAEDQKESPATDRERFDHLVVIGSSAGGVDALINLVSTLPVRTVTEYEKLAPGVVYVIASDLDVEINDHAVSVRTDANPAPKPSVDRLLETASHVFRDSLIAVILTGTGSDGALGAQAVKAHGGTVIVQ